ncbi:hypothetical protein [Paeniglutamicibacter cryotolerans]|uniref:DUF2238 domain-containing protein n=1 Tax=Paeniglutamicibacter cryotolerans TaxID=670079 RepID=A0A839QSF8_9MICC|nr:hypothetical protein [Paeniglutamicibacter cryotolerans]MBB2997615.1 hypothetical protein [Paeniglutamicibacter cryotolerans]
MLIPVEVLFVVVMGSTAVRQSWSAATIPALLLVAATVPVLVEPGATSRFPAWVHGFYLSFLLAGPFAGAQLGFYGRWERWERWERWDKVVHTSSGLLVGYATIFALGVISRRQNIGLPPVLLVGGILATGGFIAAMWEIAEFSSEHLLGTRAQNGNLEDTMTDIICGIAGATAVSIAMSLHLKGHRFPLIVSLLQERDFRFKLSRNGELEL